ncbi:hypothetical protein [Paenibacillus oceani]|nr:hypothetical protein [Paenibacillus oceani]
MTTFETAAARFLSGDNPDSGRVVPANCNRSGRTTMELGRE